MAPSLVLWLTAGDVLDRGDSVAAAISRGVAAIVVLDAGGGRLYEAACTLKSAVCDRACLIISERADVAAAVGASGVLLSDQGIPLIVVRNMMLQSQSDSLYLPVVGRIVQTATSAINASDSKGADFFVMDISRDNFDWLMDNSTSGQSLVPIFVRVSGLGDEYESSSMVSKISQLGVYGLVMSLDDMGMLDDHFLKKTFPSAHVDKISSQGRYRNPLSLCMTDVDVLNWRKSFAGFSSIAGEAIELIEAEKLLLHDAVAIFLKSAPMMAEVSLLVDATSRLTEPFLLVIVGEFNSGKSTVINALLGRRYLKEGVVPTTSEITLLCYSQSDSIQHEHCERHPNGQLICYLSSPILQEVSFVNFLA